MPAQPQLAGVIVDVGDLQAAEDFYTRLFGAPTQRREGSLSYERASQRLVVVESARPRTLANTGQHQAYRIAEGRLEGLLSELEHAGCEINHWREDHPSERQQSAYVLDPSGNRVQLVPSTHEQELLDHACVELHDLELAEIFYAQTLGGTVDYVHGWMMDDYAEAFAWGEGKDPCAPWTRRFDVRYWDKLRIARPNMQTFVRFGSAYVGLFLATEHRQEPPLEQQRGTPRLIFASDLSVSETTAHFAGQDLPFDHGGSNVFLRDPGGNFVEIRSRS